MADGVGLLVGFGPRRGFYDVVVGSSRERDLATWYKYCEGANCDVSSHSISRALDVIKPYSIFKSAASS